MLYLQLRKNTQTIHLRWSAKETIWTPSLFLAIGIATGLHCLGLSLFSVRPFPLERTLPPSPIVACVDSISSSVDVVPTPIFLPPPPPRISLTKREDLPPSPPSWEWIIDRLPAPLPSTQISPFTIRLSPSLQQHPILAWPKREPIEVTPPAAWVFLPFFVRIDLGRGEIYFFRCEKNVDTVYQEEAERLLRKMRWKPDKHRREITGTVEVALLCRE